MALPKTLLPLLLTLLTIAGHSAAAADGGGHFIYRNGGVDYPYTVKQTGDNYTFEFAKNPGGEGRKLQAAVDVLQSVYGDTSLNPAYSETFMKETALCFVFDGTFYSYRACFLPNDYSPANRDRFWGFVTQLPNALWLITRNLLPALLAFGLFFFALRKK